MISASSLGDLELLRIEIDLLWTPDERGRSIGRDLIIASSAAGLAAVIGSAVPDDLANAVMDAVTAATPPTALDVPPAVLNPCRRLLEHTLGPVS